MAKLKPGWQRVKFGEVVQLCGERSNDPGAEGIEPDDMRIHSWGDVSTGTTFTTRFRPGHVLFGKRRAYQRKVAVADFDGVCSGDIYVFETKDPRMLLPDLLPFVCRTNGFLEYAVGTSAGSLSPRTSWSSLAGYEFSLPPISEQARIQDLLSSLDTRHGALVALEASALAMLNTALLRTLAVRDGDPLRLAFGDGLPFPRDARLARLGEVARCVVPARAKPRRFDGDIPWLTVPDINSSRIAADIDARRVSRAALNEVGAATVDAGAVLMACVRSLGVVALCETTLSFNQQMHAFVPTDCLLPEYLLYALKAQKGQMLSRATETLVPFLNKENCEAIAVPVPSLAEQERIVDVLQVLESTVDAIRDARSAADGTFAVALVTSSLERGLT
jgi:type I restriction enzyme S subunit